MRVDIWYTICPPAWTAMVSVRAGGRLYFAEKQRGGVACTPGVGGAECLTLTQNLAANFAALETEEGVKHVHRGGRIGYCCVRVRIVQSQAVKNSSSSLSPPVMRSTSATIIFESNGALRTNSCIPSMLKCPASFRSI